MKFSLFFALAWTILAIYSIWSGNVFNMYMASVCVICNLTVAYLRRKR